MFSRSIVLRAVASVLFLGSASLAFGQDNIQQNENLSRLPPMLRDSPNRSDIFVNDDQTQRIVAEQAAVVRRRAIERDTVRLLQLSAQLKDQMEKSNGNFLPEAGLKMAQQIEKLAHSLKKKMAE